MEFTRHSHLQPDADQPGPVLIHAAEDIGTPVWTTGYADLGMRNVVTDTPYKNFNLNVTGAFSATVTEAIQTKPNAYTIADTLRSTRDAMR